MQKNKIYIKDKKIIKVLGKEFTKKILNCFNDAPKTATQIANSISFPKDKIYYHIKNLVKNKILMVVSKKMVMGIEQKLFLPTTKQFIIKTEKQEKEEKSKINKNRVQPTKHPANNKNKKINNETKRKKSQRRTISERRNEERRDDYNRRTNYYGNYLGEDKRLNKQRRTTSDNRKTLTRRHTNERRESSPFSNKSKTPNTYLNDFKIKSKRIRNVLLSLNGIKTAMTFVQSGDNVTFLLCNLNSHGFQIERLNNYELPFQVKDYEIKSLTELIVNISNQYHSKKEKNKVYLAIHSDDYNCEMTYVSAKGKNKKLFKKDLIKTLSSTYDFKNGESIFDYISYRELGKNATVCISNKGPQIHSDYSELVKSGLQPRYNTSIPQILNNIYTYYNIDQNYEKSLLIYIDRNKTHIVFSKGGRLYESKEFNKGLYYFQDALVELSLGNIKPKDAINNALHFLSNYGFSLETSDITIHDGIPFKKARAILDHLIIDYLDNIQESIQYFEDVCKKDGISDKAINQIFICGVGSHIQNIDNIIKNNFRVDVKNLSEYSTAYFQNQKEDKGKLIQRIKTKSIFKRKKSVESNINIFKDRIVEHEKAIESATSPESAKYRLTRLEIEKNAKLKFLDSANKKLIKNSKEFKTIKDEYLNDQQILQSDYRSISTLLEEQSEILIQKYKEHEQLGIHISEIEYQTDNPQKQLKDKDKVRKGKYENRVKQAARSRAKLGDEKESYEQEIDGFETTMVKLEESLHQINQKLENGQEEATVFEYLKDVFQTTAGAFKRSFLEHLKSIENLGKDDLNMIEKSSYLLIQNTSRVDEIKESFSAMVSGDINVDTDTLIDDSGIEVKQKLLRILSLLIEAPDNLIHLKNLTTSIIKINESQKDLIKNLNSIQNKKIQAKKSIRANQKTHTSIKKEIQIYEKDLIKKRNGREEKRDLLKYIRETMESIHELDHHTVLLKEIKPQRLLLKKEIKDFSNKILRLDSLMSSCDNSYDEFEIKHEELIHSYHQEKQMLNKKLESIGLEEEKIKKEIDSHDYKKNSNEKKTNNASIYIEQLEKQILSKKKEIENLNEEKIPLLEKLNTEKKELTDSYESKIQILADEQNEKVLESEKIKSTTIDIYFKKEVKELQKKYHAYEKTLKIAKKNKIKAEGERHKADSYLKEIKKNNMPKISKLEKQIKGWEKDLNNGRRLQERLERLDSKKNEWDTLLTNERNNNENQIEILNKTIKRKESASYRLFLKDGLNRFQNNGDIDEIAKSMSEESIAIDLEEIKKLESSFNRFYKTYEVFMDRYRKNKKDILIKLKPYGGRKKTILAKIKKAKDSIHRLKSIINRWIQKVDEKNEYLIIQQKELKEIHKNTIDNLSSIEFEIKEIPNKKVQAKIDIDKKLRSRLDQISNKKDSLKSVRDKKIRLLEIVFNKESVILKVNEAEERMLFFFREIEISKEKIVSLEIKDKELTNSKSSLELRLEKLFQKHEGFQITVSKNEEIFQNHSQSIKEKIKSNREEFAILKDQLLVVDKQKDLISNQLNKIEEDYKISNDKIIELRKKIIVPIDILKSNNEFKNKDNQKSPNKNKLLYYLTQIEKDLRVDIERFEKMIQELNIFIDTMSNEDTELQSSINLLDSDMKYFDNDLSRIQTLIENNKEHLLKISSDHRKSLNNIANIKDFYPQCKIMLNERITNLYTLLELKTRDKDQIEEQIYQIKDNIKTKRVEAAILDQELIKINKEMKNALENSFYEKEDEDNEWKWEMADAKINSYVDLAQLKNESKELFNSIVETEQKISKFKSKESSIKNMISEKEKISHKKIKRMEEICTRLELEITKEKNELNGLEEEVKQLTGLAFNYGDRIEILKKELKDFREKQTEYKLELKELGRSLDLIETKSEDIIKNQKSTEGNSIQLDYMANLGLLMNTDLQLNLLPDNHKKEFKYFRPNKILQNSVLVLITVFSLGSFLNRSKVVPLEELLPLKQSELNLLKMRQEIKTVVDEKHGITNIFTKLIENDSTISREMISILKYLSKNIPNDFKVTELTLKKNQVDNIIAIENIEDSNVLLTINGFYDKDIKNASLSVKKLEKIFKVGKKFKSIDVSNGEKLKNNRTSYSLRIVR